MCKWNCGCQVQPGFTRNLNAYDTCCKKCSQTKGQGGHDANCPGPPGSRPIFQMGGDKKKTRESPAWTVQDMIRAADHVIDMGPGAGVHGGRVMAQGTPAEVTASPESLTGRYLAHSLRIEVPAQRRAFTGETPRLRVVNARGYNLKGVTAEFPVGLLTCVTGVSGSGKSTLVNDTLYAAVARKRRRE